MLNLKNFLANRSLRSFYRGDQVSRLRVGVFPSQQASCVALQSRKYHFWNDPNNPEAFGEELNKLERTIKIDDNYGLKKVRFIYKKYYYCHHY